MEIRRKLKGDDIEVVKNLGNKRLKREIDPCLQNRLAEGHMATRGEVQSLIPGRLASRVPNQNSREMKSDFMLDRPET